MKKSIRQRVEGAFQTGDVEGADKFLDIMLSSWRRTSDAVGRTVVIIFLLAGVFEILLDSKALKSFAIGPLTLGSNTSLIQQFIPALISYLIYDSYSLMLLWADHHEAYSDIMRRVHPEISSSGLLAIVIPVIRGPWSIYLDDPDESSSRRERFDDAMKVIITIIGAVLLPVIFEIQAYYELTAKYGYRSSLLWVSAAISLFFTFAWVTKMVLSYQGN